MKTRNFLSLIILCITVTLVSCSSNETQENETEVLPPDLTNEITIYNNTAILDASSIAASQPEGTIFKWQLIDAPNDFECYQSDCYIGYNSPSYTNEILTQFTDTPEFTFLARQVGEYTINLKILDQDEVELSTNDFVIYVINEIPEFSYTNIFTEDFSSISSWSLDSYAIEQYQIDDPGVWYGFNASVISEGGDIIINNNSLSITTGTFVYMNATKNIENLSVSNTDNIKVSTRIEGESFTSRIHYFDTWDEVSDFKIQINDYKISFRHEPFLYWCESGGWQREYFLNRYNLANRDIDFYIYYNGSNTPELKVIADDINITKRFKIESSPTIANGITFHVNYDVSDYAGGGILEPENRTLNLTKLEISKFNLN